MYQSFFSLKKNPPRHMDKNKISPPHYLKDGRFVLIFQKNSFHVDNDIDKHNNKIRYVRVSLGKLMKKVIKQKYPNSLGFLKFKIPSNITENRDRNYTR